MTIQIFKLMVHNELRKFIIFSNSNTMMCHHRINPFISNAPFLYPLKISEKPCFLMFSGVRERVHWKQKILSYKDTIYVAYNRK